MVSFAMQKFLRLIRSHFYIFVFLIYFNWRIITLVSITSLIAQRVKCLHTMRDPDSNPGSGRSPGEGNGNPLQYSCLENPMGRGAW